MSAIITPSFRTNSVQDFKAGLDDPTNNHYIGIGRLIPWPNQIGDNSAVISEENSLFNEPLPQVTLAEEQDVRNELMTLVKVAENSIVIPKNSWKEGRRYKRYDPTDPLSFELEAELFPCITVSDDKIYLCIENDERRFNPPALSTFTPHVNNGSFQPGGATGVRVGDDRGDSYVWAYIGDLSENSKIDNHQFISISSDALTDASEIAAASAATGGLVYGFKVVETPSSVSLATMTMVLEGIDSSGAKIADVNIIDAGTIAQDASGNERFTIEGPASNEGINKLYYAGNSYVGAPAGYKKATVTVYNEVNGVRTKLDDIKIIPLLAPLEGFGYDIKSHTASHYIGLYSQFAESVDGEALTNAAYRQISVLKNPQRRTDDSPDDSDNLTDATLQYTDEQAIDCLNYIQLKDSDVNLQSFDPGTVISQASTGAKAQVVHVDLGAKKIYYQQQDQFLSNFLPFEGPLQDPSPGDIVADSSVSVTIQGSDIDFLYTSEYIKDTGTVLFVDNRKRINRNNDQIEDLRIIIQF